MFEMAALIIQKEDVPKLQRTCWKKHTMQIPITYLAAAVFKVHLPGILQRAGSTQLCHGHAGAVPRAIIRAGHWKNAQK